MVPIFHCPMALICGPESGAVIDVAINYTLAG